MSYRRAWLLVDDLNRCFREPVVSAQPGGSRGGGAVLTPFGHGLISSYRAIEADAHAATAAQLGGLQALAARRTQARCDKAAKSLRRAAVREEALNAPRQVGNG